ncbi:MAG TPA: sensor histidine kinase [Homoserinimonas sp.]|nr:sensor histidine kinase [Homoserinimonas sp.]
MHALTRLALMDESREHDRAVMFSRSTPLTPVFLGLRIALHTTVTLLALFVIVRAVALALPQLSWIVAMAIILLATYVSGAFLLRSGPSRLIQVCWLAAVTAEVAALVWLTSDAAFLVFPLFFLHLHLVPIRWAVPLIAGTTAFTIVALATRTGWSVGGVVGPIIGAAVAVVIGLGYRALYRETEERQRLIDDLVSTRHALAARERETGILEERERLAREIHDTVAQGLSSIQLLLHAAERTVADPQALDHLRLARETAAASLAEARQFIRELSPPALEAQSLPRALERLAEAGTQGELVVAFHLSGDVIDLPMRLETALLRIAQASLANVTRHSGASRAEMTLTYLDDWVSLDVVDNGNGFDPSQAAKLSSFGLIGLRGRVDQLGGRLSIESSPGGGTAIAASFDLADGAS